jgi:transcriptional regulator with XRE-family HTH domain
MQDSVAALRTRLGNFIRGKRIILGIDRKEMCRMVGTSRSILENIEIGRRMTLPPPSMVRKLSKALKVSPFFLIKKAGYFTSKEAASYKAWEDVSSLFSLALKGEE